MRLIMLCATLCMAGCDAGNSTLSNNDDAADTGMSAGDEYGYKEVAKMLISERLRDPDSAEFSDLVVHPKTDGRSPYICGYVNSKNGFGGFSGRQRFISAETVIIEGDLPKSEMDTVWNDRCG